MATPASDAAIARRETASVLGLSSIYALRLAGLYMVLPVLSLHAATLEGATPLWIGLSVGIYGLTQGLFQMPFGMLGDRFGRRRVIAMGLVLFSVGSMVAASADSAIMLVIGRFLQGSGAIASTLVALVSDLTRPQVRVRALAAIGAAVAVSFAAGMILGPALSTRWGVPTLFWITAVLSAFGAAYVLVGIPKPEVITHDGDWHVEDLGALLRSPTLVRLDLGIFALQAMATALFVVGPKLLVEHLPVSEHGRLYAMVVPAGLVFMVVSALQADRWGKLRETVLVAAIIAGAGFVMLWSDPGRMIYLVLAIAGTMTAVALAEPAMPAMVSRLSPPPARGTAAGLFHSCEFTGSFFGGLLAGALLEQPKVLAGCLVAIAFVWLVVSWGLPHLGPAGSGTAAAAREVDAL